VDTEIPAPAAGVLKEVLVEEGKTVAISTVVGRIEEGAGNGASATSVPALTLGATTPEAAPAPAAAKPAAPPPPAAVQEPFVAEPRKEPVASSAGPYPIPVPEPQQPVASDGPLSPLVRKMAREYNIDLRQVKGTGAGGRISKQDLETYMSAQGAKTMAQATTPAAAAQPSAPAPAAPPPMPRAQAPQARVEPMSIMRTKIAEHMLASKRTSAHVTTVHKTDLTKVAKLRDRHKAEFQQRYGYSLTYLPFVIAATVEAIHEYPILNASIEGSNIIYHNEINIGIAVALENGLIVPVIRNADEKNVLGLQRSIVDLATRARSRQLKADEVQGGTFSITNFGSFGSVFATPIINQPQVAILGIGAVEKQPVVIDDAIAIRSVAYLALTFDHRLIDGALADQFTGKVKSILENWSREIL
jgi:2-oxoglutarate dehydrogenase E2 component (dihydrolipoamide succinyltransferase)